MADLNLITVQEATVETKQKKDGTGTFKALRIVGDNAVEYTGYANDDTVVPASGDVLEMTSQAIKTKAGGFNKIISFSKSATGSTTPAVKSKAQKMAFSNHGSSAHTHSAGGSAPSQSTTATSKDISMEVSGLLQALINKNGLTDQTETLLREALNLKRRVASELENKGSV
jgi:hypothetical protein